MKLLSIQDYRGLKGICNMYHQWHSQEILKGGLDLEVEYLRNIDIEDFPYG